MAKEFASKFAAKDEVFNFPTVDFLNGFVKDSFKLQTLLLIGALLQLLLVAVLPMRWAVVPAVILLLNSIVSTIYQCARSETNPYVDGVVPGRTTAQLPTEKGIFGPDASAGSVVVFQLGVQVNHPLGILAPGVGEVGNLFINMSKELKDQRDEFGLLGSSNWRGQDRSSNNILLTTFFFKDVQSINRFAHMQTHLDAWKLYDKSPHKAHIGVFHETYIVPAKGYESLYYNCRPLLFGRASTKCETDQGEKWANTLVSADAPRLKSHYQRLGRCVAGNVIN